MNRTQSTALAALAAGLVGLVGYAIFFDYKRRHDPQFRKTLRRNLKKQRQVQKAEEESGAVARAELLQKAYQESKNMPLPTSVEEKEALFMQEIAKGELLFQQGIAPYQSDLNLLLLYLKALARSESMLFLLVTCKLCRACRAHFMLLMSALHRNKSLMLIFCDRRKWLYRISHLFLPCSSDLS